MKSYDRKILVLSTLQDQKEAVTLSALLLILNHQFSERSVRRWLHELAAKGLIIKLGRKKSTRYQAKPKQVVIETAPSVIFSAASQQIISYVEQPIYLREPTTYHIQWLQAYLPNESFYLSQSQQEFLQALGQRRYEHDIAGTYARHIYNRLLIDLSYNSSRLEGNTYSLLETEKLIIEGDISPNKLNEESVMILNHKEAIRYLVENAEKINIEEQVIATVHYLLADGLLPSHECGIIRNHGVKIGSSVYIPLDNQTKLAIHLSTICEKAAKIRNPYEQSFFLLVHIAYLQAFEDCNKRTSRLSANIPLIRENLVPLSFNDVPKEDYTNAMLAIYELNDVQPLIDLYLYSYTRTCKQYNVNIESLGFDRIRVQYRQQRRDILREIIKQKLTEAALLDYLQKQSMILIPSIDVEKFKASVLEDIRVLSLAHIRGMGIDPEAFYIWEKLRNKFSDSA